jgi:hypothetical protein
MGANGRPRLGRGKKRYACIECGRMFGFTSLIGPFAPVHYEEFEGHKKRCPGSEKVVVRPTNGTGQ